MHCVRVRDRAAPGPFTSSVTTVPEPRRSGAGAGPCRGKKAVPVRIARHRDRRAETGVFSCATSRRIVEVWLRFGRPARQLSNRPRLGAQRDGPLAHRCDLGSGTATGRAPQCQWGRPRRLVLVHAGSAPHGAAGSNLRPHHHTLSPTPPHGACIHVLHTTVYKNHLWKCVHMPNLLGPKRGASRTPTLKTSPPRA